MRSVFPLLWLSPLFLLGGFPLSCNYQPPFWDVCCICECEACDVQPDRIFAPANDIVECWEECDEACGTLGSDECGDAADVAGCPVEQCVEYVGLGEECDGALGQSEAPAEICTYYFKECEHPDWACSGGICVES